MITGKITMTDEKIDISKITIAGVFALLMMRAEGAHPDDDRMQLAHIAGEIGKLNEFLGEEIAEL
jgi:hypothetical protein